MKKDNLSYLKKYNLSEEEIKEIENSIDNSYAQKELFIYEKEKVIEILDLFVSIGVTNIYGIMILNPELFFENYNFIKDMINSYDDKDTLAKLINEDANNLKLIGLY